MREELMMAGAALAGALVVVIPGAVALRLLRGRSIVAHLAVLVTVVVLAVLAGVIGVARQMFISHHDLRVLLVVISVAGAVSLATGWWLGRRLAADAMWADEARARERLAEANRRDLVAWVSHDLRTPLAGLRASEPELSRIVANLLRNAIRYTPSDGTVTVSGGRDGDAGWFAVTAACGGTPAGDLPREFDVAFRGEAARTPKS